MAMYCNPSDPTAVQPGFPMMPAPGLLLQPHRPQRACRVSFHDTRMEVRVVSLACLSDELRRDIWYTPSDIEGMRSEARDLCRFLRVNPGVESDTRGLELRISLERQCRKQLTVQGVVEAQRRSTDPAFLATLAQRCSMVPKELALQQAQSDYCTVYVGGNAAAAAAAPPALGVQEEKEDPANPFATAGFPTAASNMLANMNLQQHPNMMMMGNQQHFMMMAGNPNFMLASHHAQQQPRMGLQVQQIAPLQHPQQQMQHHQTTTQQLLASQQGGDNSSGLDCDISLEPIPLSAPDQSLVVLQGNKRMLSIFEQQHNNDHNGNHNHQAATHARHQHQDHHHVHRIVRPRTTPEGYPAA